jgi:integrase
LKEHQQAQFKLMQDSGENWRDQDLIFTTIIRTPADKYKLLKSFKRLCREAGLPQIRFYDLRHTAASLMLNNGIYWSPHGD